MIKGKTIYLGFGDIAVNNSYGYITFREFEPATNPGGAVPQGVKYTSDMIVVPLTMQQCRDLIAHSEKARRPKNITTGDWTIDFSNYNPASVAVVAEAAKQMLNYLIQEPYGMMYAL